jgi:recombination protein RecA
MTKLQIPEVLLANLENMLDKEGIVGADAILDVDGQIIPVCPSVDIGLNGGVPEGSWVILTGKPKTGKTTLALRILANAQQEEFGGRNGYYLNIEGRLKKMNLDCVSGFRNDKFIQISSHKKKIYSAEDYLESALMIMRDDPGSVIIIDSLAALCHSKEMIIGMGEEAQMAMIPKLVAKFTRKANQIIPVNKNIVICITHMMGNPGKMGRPEVEKGGYEISYQADIKLQATHIEKKTKGDKVFGHICYWNVLCSALGAPFQKIPMHLRYGAGVDVLAEIVELGATYGFITKKSSWLSYNTDSGEEIKVQGSEKFIQHLSTHAEVADEIYNKIRSLVL